MIGNQCPPPTEAGRHREEAHTASEDARPFGRAAGGRGDPEAAGPAPAALDRHASLAMTLFGSLAWELTIFYLASPVTH